MVVIIDAVNLLQLWSQTAQSWSCSPGCARPSNPGKSQALNDLFYKWEEPVPTSQGCGDLTPSFCRALCSSRCIRLWRHRNRHSGALPAMLVLGVTHYLPAEVLHTLFSLLRYVHFLNEEIYLEEFHWTPSLCSSACLLWLLSRSWSLASL